MQEAGVRLSEAKMLMRGWTRASFDTTANSIRYHFRRHGHEVGAANVWHYLRQAHSLRRNLRGARRTALDAGKVRYVKHHRFLILDAQGKIISYGASS